MRKHIAAWELLAQYALSYCIDSRLPRTRAPISCNQATDNSAADAASSKGLTMTKGTSSCPGSVDHLILMVLACRFWHIHTYVRADVHTYHLCHTPSFFFTQHLSHTTLSHTFFFTTRSFTTSFVFPSFPVPLQHMLFIIVLEKMTCGAIWSFN